MPLTVTFTPSTATQTGKDITWGTETDDGAEVFFQGVTANDAVINLTATNCSVSPASRSTNTSGNTTAAFDVTASAGDVGQTYSATWEDGGGDTYSLSGTILDKADIYVTIDSVTDNVSGAENFTSNGTVSGLPQWTIAADYNSGGRINLSNVSTNSEYRARLLSNSEDRVTGQAAGTVQAGATSITLTLPGRSALGTGSLLPDDGTSTEYWIDTRIKNSSDAWEVCFIEGSSPVEDAKLRIVRSAFVAPVISSIGTSGTEPNLDTTINTSSSGSGGTLRYAQTTGTSPPAAPTEAENVTNSDWVSSANFTQARNTTRTYHAARLYNHPDYAPTVEAVDSFTYNLAYVTPTACNAISNFSIAAGATDFNVSITGGASPTIYEVRTGGYTGTLVSSFLKGNGTLTVTTVPANGASIVYYLSGYVATSDGGEGTAGRINIDTFTVTKNYYLPDPANAIADFDIDEDDTTWSVTLSGTDTRTTHRLRTGGYTGTVVDTATGNTTIGDSATGWSVNTSRTYYLTAYVSTGNGGEGTAGEVNVDSFAITRVPDAAVTPTDITFSPASTAAANINVTTTITPSGNFTALQINKDGGAFQTADASNQVVFTNVPRGTSAAYRARAINFGSTSGERLENYTPPYLSRNDSITAITDKNISFTQVDLDISIAGGQTNQVYQVRENNSGTLSAPLDSVTGNGTLTIPNANLPAQTDPVGAPQTFSITTYRTAASGGDDSDVSGSIDDFIVTRAAPQTAPDQYDLGGPITNVEVSSGNYESNTISMATQNLEVDAPISITGGQFKINSGAYTSTATDIGPTDSVTVRVSAAATVSTTNTATLSIGPSGSEVTDTFSVTTEATTGGGGGSTGEEPAGTYGLRCYDDATTPNITLDVRDRVASKVEYISTSLTTTQTQKDVTLSRDAAGFIWKNPPSSLIDTTVSPPRIKEEVILDFELTTSTNLRIKRQAHNNTGVTAQVLLFYE